jgi:hypothetical protein
LISGGDGGGNQMNGANSDKQSRPYWENRIVECSYAIPFDKPGWFTGKEFDDFVDAWVGLKRYYTKSGEVVIGLEPIGVLNSVIRLLSREIYYQNPDAGIRDQAMEALAGLQAVILEVVTEAVMNQIDKNDSNN